VDRLQPSSVDGLTFRRVDLATCSRLPYESGYFQAVTMLAVAEHLPCEVAARVFEEAYRVLAGGGRFIVTTPAPWSDGLLRGMARIGLVSGAEIEEHQRALSRCDLVGSLAAAGFQRARIESGYFEGGLNIWAAASK
jgi:SAM-dependent methyltransferase